MDYLITVAAGTGSRYGGDLPKQFCPLGGRPLLMTTLERLSACAPGASLIVVLSEPMTGPWREMCREQGFTLPHSIVTGGATRAESVRNALRTIPADTVGWIAVHDAARPVVTPGMFRRLVDALPGADGVIPAIPVTDSLRALDGTDGASHAVDRSTLRAVQTPQLFPGVLLIAANDRELLPTFTDDASVMEAAGHTALRLVEGDTRNIKVTNPGDMAIAEMHLRSL